MHEFLLVAGLVLWTAVGIAYFRHPAASMFHPVTYYWLQHGLLFVTRPLLDYFYTYTQIYELYQFTPSVGTKNTVLAASDLCLLAFTYVALKVGPMPLRVKQTAAIAIRRGGYIVPFLLIAALCLPLAAYSLADAIRNRSTGSSTMTLDAVNGAIINTTGNGYFQDSHHMLLTITVVFAWLMRFRLWSTLPFLIYFVVGSTTGGRGPVITGAIAFALLYLFQNHRRWPSARVVGGLMIVIAMFRLVGDDRGASIRALFGGEKVKQAVADQRAPLENMDFANMEFTEYMVHIVPAKTGTYGYFLDNLQILTEPIPRALWSGKPVGPPIKKFLIFSYGYPIGITFSVVGEGWAQLGWLGVAIWGGVFGAIYGYAYRSLMRSKQSLFQVSAYAIFMSEGIIAFRDGLLISALKACLFPMLPLVLWKLSTIVFGHKRLIQRRVSIT